MNRKGFTLIELLIVIVILGILMGTIIPKLCDEFEGIDCPDDGGVTLDLSTFAEEIEAQQKQWKKEADECEPMEGYACIPYPDSPPKIDLWDEVPDDIKRKAENKKKYGSKGYTLD